MLALLVVVGQLGRACHRPHRLIIAGRRALSVGESTESKRGRAVRYRESGMDASRAPGSSVRTVQLQGWAVSSPSTQPPIDCASPREPTHTLAPRNAVLTRGCSGAGRGHYRAHRVDRERREGSKLDRCERVGPGVEDPDHLVDPANAQHAPRKSAAGRHDGHLVSGVLKGLLAPRRRARAAHYSR
jgi:hypothetical protein